MLPYGRYFDVLFRKLPRSVFQTRLSAMTLLPDVGVVRYTADVKVTAGQHRAGYRILMV